MPRRPPKLCTYPGCNALVEGGRCRQHQRIYERHRGSSSSRGYGARWQRYRAEYLKRHPFCVMCRENGDSIPAVAVDHIRSVQGPGDPMFWAPSNHQALCISHHSRKTVARDGGFGRARKLQPRG